MIQLSNLEELKKEDIPKLVNLINPELNKRTELYERYRRKSKSTDLIGKDNDKVIVPFEKYIIDMATGYLGGKEPTYEVEDTTDEEKKNIIKKILNKVIGEKNYKESMEVLIDYITKYNDDGSENYQLVKDILITSACYEVVYENEDNEIVYARKDPLQTIAIWDYSVPRNLIGVVNIHTEQDISEKEFTIVELTDKDGTRKFKGSGSQYEEITDKKERNHNWGDVPYAVVEIPDGISLFEPVIKLIEAYENLVQETKETFTYNNQAKLKITGYRPEHELLIPDDKGNLIQNPDRIKEDETLLNMKVFYTPEDGDIDWIIKDIPDTAIQDTLKTYIDLIMMNTGVPQTTDLGFTKADNASAIDRKFFSIEQNTTQAMQLLRMAYLRRWELIFGRLNLKKGNKYDFRDIKITLNKNLPANENEVVDMYMKLRGLISDETIIERLPLNFDATSELNKIDEQDEVNLEKEVNKAKAFNNNQDNKEEDKKDNKQEEKIKKESEEK